MLKQVYKTIERDSGKITIYGSNKPIKTYYKQPEWSEDLETAFKYRGNEYFISEFMVIDKNIPDFMQEFDGYLNDSAFSGVLIKLVSDDLIEEEKIKAYTFIS